MHLSACWFQRSRIAPRSPPPSRPGWIKGDSISAEARVVGSVEKAEGSHTRFAGPSPPLHVHVLYSCCRSTPTILRTTPRAHQPNMTDKSIWDKEITVPAELIEAWTRGFGTVPMHHQFLGQWSGSITKFIPSRRTPARNQDPWYLSQRVLVLGSNCEDRCH